ncbi:trigger factor [Candidatus Gracilibacteria bacterium]|nr:trigger factor [Candidatus Gracilibacteria bacterium]MCF7819437.1 trigger factor [Candidatus Gracilibacteria bacterium]
MAEKIKTIPGSKRAFSFVLTEDDLKKSQEVVLSDVQKNIAIKGFRKGNVPKEVVRKHIGEQKLFLEAMNTALEKKYSSFIREHQLQPVSSPEIDFSDIKKLPVEVKAEVEVFPEIELGNYQKIKLNPVKVEVTEKDIDETIEMFLKESKAGKKVDRKAEKGDLLEVDFEGKDEEGKTIPNTKGENVTFVVGMGQFLPDLEKAFAGMNPGEKKEDVKVSFPNDYPAKDIAGKKIRFDIVLHSVQELSAKNIDEALIEKLTGRKKKVSEFRTDIREMVERQKKDQEKKKQIQEYKKRLLKIVKGDIPTSWKQKEVEMRMQEIKNHPQYQHDPENFWKQIGKKEEDMKKEFELQAENELKVFLALSKIIQQENIHLDKDEEKKAEHLARHRTNQAPEGTGNYEDELQRTKLNLKIDKYLEGLML